MRFLIGGALAIGAVCLGACNKPAEGPEGAVHHGRYVGIGIYAPGIPWTKMVAADAPKVVPAARTIDDQAIIVVVDSDTGDIRGCGDMTGYCIGMNPWKKALTQRQIVPINLSEHMKPQESAVVEKAAEPAAASPSK
ncbi:MAG: hypothetical protein M3T55_03425 [Pseudomonadota bacterium]|nr:hypothetical protein [Pseudomonadota bacterium]